MVIRLPEVVRSSCIVDSSSMTQTPGYMTETRHITLVAARRSPVARSIRLRRFAQQFVTLWRIYCDRLSRDRTRRIIVRLAHAEHRQHLLAAVAGQPSDRLARTKPEQRRADRGQ